MRNAGRALTFSLIAVAGGAAAAQDEDRAAMLMAADQVLVEGERVVRGGAGTATATKIDTLLIDIPQAITVVTNAAIEDQAMRSMADVVRYAPGVSMGQGEGHRDAPTIRGNSSTADFYVDGVRDDLQYFRDLYNVERIEVLKGPNALIFGRGGAGGVINRVTKKAGWTRVGELRAQGGSYGFGRGSLDVGGGVADAAALRLSAAYENSDSYREFVGVERFGANPTGAFKLPGATELRLSYEYFSDARTVDRGVPSQNGLPYAGSRTAFFGNPDQSDSDVAAHLAAATLAHDFGGGLKLRNHTVFADYGKFYENVHANSAVGPTGDVSLQAYFSATDRRNVFNQTDLVWEFATGSLAHALLVGVELGMQDTDNLRAANNNAAGIVNVADPTIFTPVAYSPLNADNHVALKLAAAYVQDQIELSDRLILVAGARFDHFDLEFADNLPGGADFSRTDDVVSPRAGLVFKAAPDAALYASYSISFLPQSGDQFSALNATTAALAPERFENVEAGIKWDITPALAFTAAIYRLDRDNTRAVDPVTSLTVLTGAQRSRGVELGLAGEITNRWRVQAAYAAQDAEITRDTTAAPAGRIVPLVPRHSFSLWNSYQFTKRVGAGVGIIRQSEMFASISNAVVLPAFTRVDAALYFVLNEHLEAQLNVENLLDEIYWGAAHNDNNITPGSPRAFRASITARL